MFSILQTFVALCLFRARPQDLPTSNALLWMAAMLAVISGVQDLSRPLASVILALVQIALVAALVQGMLRLRNFPDRATQTLTALFGANAVLNLLSLPVISWLREVGETDPTPQFFALLLVGWILAVTATILRESLEVSRGAAIGLSIGLSLVVLMLTLPLVAWLVPAA
ncbi:MAG: hypothetical protein LJE84_10525 [Gammaproteobacteria bacterium]|nr:hypothetical protein [Gammaproteobacteria bacterium]